MLLIDKSTIYSLHFDEVVYLDKYYSLVVSPILMRELLSTLAKESSPKKDWQKTLSILAEKTNTFNSYTPANAHNLAVGNIFGHEVPLDGRIPLPGGKKIRTRDGSYAAFFDEAPEREILRRWKDGDFSEEMFLEAKKIRDLDLNIDLAALQKDLSHKLDYMPKFKTLDKLVEWIDESFLRSMSQDFLLSLMAVSLVRPDQIKEVLNNWKMKEKQSIQKYCPYAFYYFRVNLIYFTGLARGLISPGKSAKTHLDIQYIYYLPFSHCFASNDNFLLNISKYFKRDKQIIIDGNHLKVDLQTIKKLFDGDSFPVEERSYGMYPPEISASITYGAWKTFMAPKQKKQNTKDFGKNKKVDKKTSRIIRTMEDAVDVETNQTLKPRKSEFVSMSLQERQYHFINKVFDLIKINEHEDWDEIRKVFSVEEVYEIYDLHASIWHPDDNFKQLATQFIDETSERKRFLYLGDIYQEDIVEDIYRWSIYFDQILIPDPFHTPWAKKHDYNPLNDTQVYLRDTLKLVYFLTLVSPLINSEKLVIVPDVTDFDPKLKERFFKMAEGKIITSQQKNAMLESQKFSTRKFKDIVRLIATLEETKWVKCAESIFGKQNIPVPVQLFKEARENDPICIDRNIELKDVQISRTGASLEEALYLCAVYDATPFSSLKVRTLQFLELAKNEKVIAPKVSSFFKDMKTLKFVNPTIVGDISANGMFLEFENLLEHLATGKDSFEIENDMDFMKDNVNKSINGLAKFHGDLYDLDGNDLIISREWQVAYNDNGLSTPEISALIEEIYPGRSKKIPKLFIGLPEESPEKI